MWKAQRFWELVIISQSDISYTGEKKVWDVVNTIRPKLTNITQTKKKEKYNAIVSKIIK